MQWRLIHIEMSSNGDGFTLKCHPMAVDSHWMTSLTIEYHILHGHLMTFSMTFDHIIGNNVNNFFPDKGRPENTQRRAQKRLNGRPEKIYWQAR